MAESSADDDVVEVYWLLRDGGVAVAEALGHRRCGDRALV